jgi:hypothetical protein
MARGLEATASDTGGGINSLGRCIPTGQGQRQALHYRLLRNEMSLVECRRTDCTDEIGIDKLPASKQPQ